MMSKEKPIHVVPRENGWAITREGASRAIKIMPTKATAKKAASKYSKMKVPVFLHDTNGTIQEVFTPRTRPKTPAKNLTKATKQRVHVVPRDDEWVVQRENQQQPSKTFSTKYSAIRYAHRLSDNAKAAMVVHNSNGQINHIDIPPHYNSMLADVIHLR